MKSLEQYIRKGYFYQSVVEDGSDIIFIVDFDGNILYHNASVLETLGYRAKALIGKNFFDYILPETLADLRRQFRNSQRRAYTEKVEFQFLCKDLTYRFLEFNAINLKHKEGLPGFILDCRDIAQRKRDEEELVRLQKAKEQFLANISHEIRTPINGIAGMASLLSKNANPEEQETYLNAIRNSAENLKVIINDLLDLAAIESGKLKLEKIAFNLTDIIPALLTTFTYQAREKKLTLSHSIDPKLNKILLGDPVRLNQILLNLISNALKFTHAGSIEVNCTAEREQRNTLWVRIEVKDTGVGIPAEKLNTIFESFSQADASVTRKYGGTGLGLTIVKQLVELQYGGITVKSQEHVGSKFIVLIPYTVGKARDFNSSTLLVGEKHHDEIESNSLSVLLVEDNDINRLYAKSILKTWHCETETAENGLVAIEHLKNKSFDVVLMDVQMPVMDGYEATRAIRMMEPPINNVPIVALTANATKIDIDRCLSAGMNDYLSKPFTPEDLYRKLYVDLKIKPTEKPQMLPRKTRKQSRFDLQYLREVSGNNEEFIREMIQTFVDTIPNILTDMSRSLETQDWEKVSRLAHQIKPSLTLMGLSGLKDTILFIEEHGKKQTELVKLASKVQGFVEECSGAINDLIHDYSINSSDS